MLDKSDNDPAFTVEEAVSPETCPTNKREPPVISYHITWGDKTLNQPTIEKLISQITIVNVLAIPMMVYSNSSKSIAILYVMRIAEYDQTWRNDKDSMMSQKSITVNNVT